MKKLASLVSLALVATALALPALAEEGDTAKTTIPHLDHVFVIMMENHAYGQIVGNKDAPFANSYMKSANMATKYYAVGHPSSTNYLEIVGGSNFGVRSDNGPDWHNGSCTPNLMTNPPATNFDKPNSGPVCPIWGTGTDAATPVVDDSGNECTKPCSLIDVDGVLGFDAVANTVGKTIADQLADKGMSWKSYQESLPRGGADNVTYSDGYFTDLSVLPPGIPSGDFLKLYAAKHNPFVYFKSVQDDLKAGKKNIVGFEGGGGLWEDLAAGKAPDFSFIAPNQCNDQHGRANGGSQCDFDPETNGTQTGLNPALIYVGDLKLRSIVHAIHGSKAWREERSAIVVVWDENDYSYAPNVNRVLLIVDTNYGHHGVTSSQFYTHFSLLKTIEAGFGLPCLNHACDADAKVMTDLFGD